MAIDDSVDEVDDCWRYWAKGDCDGASRQLPAYHFTNPGMMECESHAHILPIIR